MTDNPFSKIQPRAGFTPCAGFFRLRSVVPHWFVFLAVVQNRLFCPKNKTFSSRKTVMMKLRRQLGMRKGKQGCRI